MIYTICSDIQGNYTKLDAFLKNVPQNSKILCLGDITQSGASFNDNRCIEKIIENRVISIRGNHEEKILEDRKKALEKIYASNLNFIHDLPSRRIIEDKYLLIHDSLHKKGKRIRSNEDAKTELKILKREYHGCHACFYGHSHKASVFENDLEGIRQLDNLFDREIILDDNKDYMINPGGIGLYDNMPLSYIIFDTDRKELRFRRL